MSSVKAIIAEGLREGLRQRIANLFVVLAQAGERDAETRFRNGIDNSVRAYGLATKILDQHPEGGEYGD